MVKGSFVPAYYPLTRCLSYYTLTGNCLGAVCDSTRVCSVYSYSGGIGWTDNKGSETAVEGYSMAGVRAVWKEKAKGGSKLETTGKLMDNECKACCVGMDCNN